MSIKYHDVNVGVTLGDGLPTILQYLESSGTQYIDTGLIADSDTNVSVLFWNFMLAGTIVLGARGSGGIGDNMYEIMCQSSGLYLDFGATRERVNPNPAGVGPHLIEIANKKAYLDGTLLKTYTDTFATTYSQILFGFRTGPNVSISAKERIYRVIYSKGGVVLRDFVPVLDSDNVACMLDQVSGRYYYNAGTGDFITP